MACSYATLHHDPINYTNSVSGLGHGQFDLVVRARNQAWVRAQIRNQGSTRVRSGAAASQEASRLLGQLLVPPSGLNSLVQPISMASHHHPIRILMGGTSGRGQSSASSSLVGILGKPSKGGQGVRAAWEPVSLDSTGMGP